MDAKVHQRVINRQAWTKFGNSTGNLIEFVVSNAAGVAVPDAKPSALVLGSSTEEKVVRWNRNYSTLTSVQDLSVLRASTESTVSASTLLASTALLFNAVSPDAGQIGVRGFGGGYSHNDDRDYKTVRLSNLSGHSYELLQRLIHEICKKHGIHLAHDQVQIRCISVSAA